MDKSQQFDFSQPSRDTLFGIYVEASDLATTPVAETPIGEAGKTSLCQVEQLFGITMTVSDENTANRPRAV